MKRKLSINIIYNILIVFFLFTGFTSCQVNKYKDGKKHGKWVEYFGEVFSLEVPKDSSMYLRKLKYSNGYPEGLVKDYFSKSGKLQGEQYLISGPYLQNSERPEDKFKGLVKWFDENNGNIIGWEYYDNYGILDIRKYYTVGFSEISKDNRFDRSFFLSQQEPSFNTTIKLFEMFENKSDLFDSESNKIINRMNSNPNLREFLEGDNGGFYLRMGVIMGLEDLIEGNQSNDYNSNNSNSQRSSSDNEYKNSFDDYRWISCSSCQGTGKRECRDCGGKGIVRCSQCSGRGITYRNGNEETCYVCNGRGTTVCNDCNGKGNRGSCSTCSGSGRVKEYY